ncbi:RNA polymerase sigma factor [Portibacter lacus]|uniref:DNA-directed RNA polymerase sigma-70 factor n=1 Tax=Portibacter lacus TaxID=1099794 RepID=A0AA37SP27_9BACT|nr:RNA polymerase sigma factor [Portibacter lacus]GLR17395.1 DNA-directed RNA polymerase sigma-70 factor [Portibacter lacus]
MQSDNELIQLVQAGDSGKVGVLYERHKKDLFYYFYRMTNDKLKSEDLVQNTFLKVLRFSHHFKKEQQFNYWLYSIGRNVFLDTVNKKDVLKNSATEDALYNHKDTESIIDSAMEKEEKHEMLHIALNRLDPKKKEAIVLSRFQGLKYKDIATLTNSTETNIKSRIRRGIEDLKIIMNKLELR